MQVTQQDIDNYLNGGWDLDEETYNFIAQQEKENTRQLFNCVGFRATNKNGYTIIYHTCTKSTGYQISYFNKHMEAISDIFADTLELLTEKAIDTFNILNQYKIEEVMI